MMRPERKSPTLARGTEITEAAKTSISSTQYSPELWLAQALLAAGSIPPEVSAAMLILVGEVRP